MRAVDTNVVVRLVTRDDDRQAGAAEAFVQPGAWVSHLVLMEVTWVLDSVYGLEPAQLGTAVEMLLGHKHLAIEQPEVVVAALEQFRRRPALGFSDCLILEVARKAGHHPLGAFDKEMGKLRGAHRL